MWEKIKNIFAVIGAVLAIAFFTFVLVFLRRRDSDRRGSREPERADTAVEDGITECEGRAGRIEERIDNAAERAEYVKTTAAEGQRIIAECQSIIDAVRARGQTGTPKN